MFLYESKQGERSEKPGVQLACTAQGPAHATVFLATASLPTKALAQVLNPKPKNPVS